MSFRTRILLAMMAVVAGISAAAFVVAERSVDSAWQRASEGRFESEVESFLALREARLRVVLSACRDLARSVRLVAAVHEGDPDLLYRIAADELRDVLTPPPGDPTAPAATFFRFVDAGGHVIPPPDARAGLAEKPSEVEPVARLGASLDGLGAQQVGYLAPRPRDRAELHEIVATALVDPVTGERLGALVLGFPMADRSEASLARTTAIRSGIWLDGRLFSGTIPPAAVDRIGAAIGIRPDPRGGEPSRMIAVGDVPHRLFARPLSAGPDFPPAFLVGLYSMEESVARRAALRRRLLASAGIATVLGFGLSVVLARGLSVPIRDLVAGAARVRAGNLDARVPVRRRDEVGRLAGAFNEMTEGLALKERYRGLLELVADPGVAEEMIADRIPLEGDLREVTTLFCDIRGFTAQTEHMDPRRVIALLNEHMTLLTRIVYDHDGVVDKLVGDGLMALFGTPRSSGDDARNAIRAAWRMIEERRRLNETSAEPVQIGIGIASGPVVAGLMGSPERRTYTVLGASANLASRLCDRAGAMEILIDAGTLARAGDRIRTEALPPLVLKGFTDPVAAYRVEAIA